MTNVVHGYSDMTISGCLIKTLSHFLMDG